MKQNDNNNSESDNKEMEQLTEEFDEKVNFIQNEDDE
jgi:hypothetical protein